MLILANTTRLALHCVGSSNTFCACSYACFPDESFQQRGVDKVKMVGFLNLAQLASFEQLGQVRKLFCQGRAERGESAKIIHSHLSHLAYLHKSHLAQGVPIRARCKQKQKLKKVLPSCPPTPRPSPGNTW